MATSKERAAELSLIKSATEFSSNYLNGETRCTAEEFISAKNNEAVSKTTGRKERFDSYVTSAFTNGLPSLDEKDGNYDVVAMFSLWKTTLKELKELQKASLSEQIASAKTTGQLRRGLLDAIDQMVAGVISPSDGMALNSEANKRTAKIGT